MPSVGLGNTTNQTIMLLASGAVKNHEKIRRSGLILVSNEEVCYAADFASVRMARVESRSFMPPMRLV